MAELLEKLQPMLLSRGFSHINFHFVVLLFSSDSLTYLLCFSNTPSLVSDQEYANQAES